MEGKQIVDLTDLELAQAISQTYREAMVIQENMKGLNEDMAKRSQAKEKELIPKKNN